HVEQPDPGSGDVHVRLNLGYRFSDEMVWPAPAWENRYASLMGEIVGRFGDEISANSINLQETASNHIGGDAGGSGDSVGFGFGASRTLTVLRTQVALADITGDGLPDQLMKRPEDDFVRVKINLGTSFDSEERHVHVDPWPVDPAPDDFQSFLLG